MTCPLRFWQMYHWLRHPPHARSASSATVCAGAVYSLRPRHNLPAITSPSTLHSGSIRLGMLLVGPRPVRQVG